MTHRCLVLIYGAAFRNRAKTPQIGPREIADQRLCTASHIGFREYLRDAYHYDCDTHVVTYRTKHDKKLRHWYGTDRILFLNKRMPTARAMYQFALRSAPLDDRYDFLLFFRMDIALKTYFQGVFRPHCHQLTVAFPSRNED